MLMVVTLTVRRDALDSFRTFEHEAARIMAKHGGSLERTVVLKTRADEPHKEVHIVAFPSPMHLREVSVVKTDLAIGEPGPNYGADV